MRGDDRQDMDDVAFLIRHDAVTRSELEEAFRLARIPDVLEYHEAFAKAKPRVRAMAEG